MSDTLHALSSSIIDGQQLSFAQMQTAFDEIMEGKASPVQLSCFLIALKMRGETPVDIAAGASVLRQKPPSLKMRQKMQLILLAQVVTGLAPSISRPLQVLLLLVAALAWPNMAIRLYHPEAVPQMC